MGNTQHKTITVEKLLLTCRSGDIILFSGNGMFSLAVSCISHSHSFSHIGKFYFLFEKFLIEKLSVRQKNW